MTVVQGYTTKQHTQAQIETETEENRERERERRSWSYASMVLYSDHTVKRTNRPLNERYARLVTQRKLTGSCNCLNWGTLTHEGVCFCVRL